MNWKSRQFVHWWLSFLKERLQTLSLSLSLSLSWNLGFSMTRKPGKFVKSSWNPCTSTSGLFDLLMVEPSLIHPLFSWMRPFFRTILEPVYFQWSLSGPFCGMLFELDFYYFFFSFFFSLLKSSISFLKFLLLLKEVFFDLIIRFTPFFIDQTGVNRTTFLVGLFNFFTTFFCTFFRSFFRVHFSLNFISSLLYFLSLPSSCFLLLQLFCCSSTREIL